MDPKNQTILSKPIVYGSVSQCTGKKVDKFFYKWIVYVRGINNEDLTPFVEKVVFILHDSFKDNIRTIRDFPYQLEEIGWGQFEILIRIHFKEEYNAYPVEIGHMLKFHPTQASKKPYQSEYYDELIFVNPSNHFRDLVQSTIVERDAEQTALQEQHLAEELKDVDREKQGVGLLNSQNSNAHALKESTEWNLNALTALSNFEEANQADLLEEALAYVRSEIEGISGKILTIDDEIKKATTTSNNNLKNSSFPSISM